MGDIHHVAEKTIVESDVLNVTWGNSHTLVEQILRKWHYWRGYGIVFFKCHYESLRHTSLVIIGLMLAPRDKGA